MRMNPFMAKKPFHVCFCLLAALGTALGMLTGCTGTALVMENDWQGKGAASSPDELPLKDPAGVWVDLKSGNSVQVVPRNVDGGKVRYLLDVTWLYKNQKKPLWPMIGWTVKTEKNLFFYCVLDKERLSETQPGFNPANLFLFVPLRYVFLLEVRDGQILLSGLDFGKWRQDHPDQLDSSPYPFHPDDGIAMPAEDDLKKALEKEQYEISSRFTLVRQTNEKPSREAAE